VNLSKENFVIRKDERILYSVMAKHEKAERINENSLLYIERGCSWFDHLGKE
jgi:dUTPase